MITIDNPKPIEDKKEDDVSLCGAGNAQCRFFTYISTCLRQSETEKEKDKDKILNNKDSIEHETDDHDMTIDQNKSQELTGKVVNRKVSVTLKPEMGSIKGEMPSKGIIEEKEDMDEELQDRVDDIGKYVKTIKKFSQKRSIHNDSENQSTEREIKRKDSPTKDGKLKQRDNKSRDGKSLDGRSKNARAQSAEIKSKESKSKFSRNPVLDQNESNDSSMSKSRDTNSKVTNSKTMGGSKSKYGVSYDHLNPGKSHQLAEDEIATLLEVPNFPCQLRDFSMMNDPGIDQLYQWEEQFGVTELVKNIIETNPVKKTPGSKADNEMLDCLLVGRFPYEGQKIPVFYVLTSKRILILQEISSNLQLFKMIEIRVIESIFVREDEIIMYRKGGDSCIVKLYVGFTEDCGIEMQKKKKQGSTSTDKKGNVVLTINNEKDPEIPNKAPQSSEVKKEKSKIHNIRVAMKFVILIWRNYFSTAFQFIRVMKLPDEKTFRELEGIKLTTSELVRKIIQGLKSRLDEGKKQIEMEIIAKEAALRKNHHYKRISNSKDKDEGTSMSTRDRGGEPQFIVKNMEENYKPFDGLAYMINGDDARNPTYCQVILKFQQDFLIIYDIYNSFLAFLDMKKVVLVRINRARYIAVLNIKVETEHFKKEPENILKKNQDIFDVMEMLKIIFFANSTDDPDFPLFLEFVNTLVEFNRKKIFDYDLRECLTKFLTVNIFTDHNLFYSLSKNNISKNETLIKENKITINKWESQEKKNFFSCCSKKKNPQKFNNLTTVSQVKFLKSLKEEDEETGCLIL